MKKRITVMLLCACMSVSAYTGVQAADLSSGNSDSDVQIEMEEVDDSEDEADFTDAEDGLFSDGSDDTQTGDISAIEPGTGLPGKETGSPESDRCP